MSAQRSTQSRSHILDIWGYMKKGKQYFKTWSHERSPPELRHCIVGKAIVDDQAKNRSVTTHLGWQKNMNMKIWKNFNGITKVVFCVIGLGNCIWPWPMVIDGHWPYQSFKGCQFSPLGEKNLRKWPIMQIWNGFRKLGFFLLLQRFWYFLLLQRFGGSPSCPQAESSLPSVVWRYTF